MLKNLLHKYLHEDQQIQLIGWQCAILSGILLTYYIFKAPANNGLIAMVTGLLLNSLMMSSTYTNHSSIQRLYYGAIVAIISGIAFSIGSIAGDSYWLSSLGMLIVLPFIGMSNQRHILLAAMTFYFFDGYILGIGMPAPSNQAFLYGCYYATGGLLIILGGVIRINIRSVYLNIHEDIPFITKEPFFCFNNLIYTIGLIITVLVCNAISFYFKLPHGYWLPMTAFLLIKNEHATSIKRAVNRFIGTLLGGALAFCLCRLINNQLTLAIIMIPLIYLTVIAIARNYGSFTFFLTITISCLLAIITPHIIDIIYERLIYTFLGVLIVIFILQILKYLTSYNLKDQSSR